MKRPSTPTVETVTVDVIEEPAPGAVTIAEFEETEVRGRRPLVEQAQDRSTWAMDIRWDRNWNL